MSTIPDTEPTWPRNAALLNSSWHETSEKAYRLTPQFVEADSFDAIDPDRVLGAFLFQAPGAAALENARFPVCRADCSPVGGPAAAEVWLSEGTIRREVLGAVDLAFDGVSLFGSIALEDCDDGLETRVREAYAEALNAMRALGYTFPYRIWNFLPGINRADGHGLERYRAFCKGRALAFFEDAGQTQSFLPAGTCVGCREGAIGIGFLATRRETRINIENPLQVPAYSYPKDYGPRPPSFARATFLATQAGRGELYISGTASIVGHRSIHRGDLAAQCQTIMTNLDRLLDPANLARFGFDRRYDSTDLDMVKVYVRHTADMPYVQDFCRRHLPSATLLFLEADICRQELLVEIEGIVSAHPAQTTG